MAVILPLTSSPNQQIQVSLPINGTSVTLNLELSYNTAGGFWVMSIRDTANNLLVDSVPLITGCWPAANILAPYGYLGIGDAFVINGSGGALDIPDDQSLGSSFQLLWDSN